MLSMNEMMTISEITPVLPRYDAHAADFSWALAGPGPLCREQQFDEDASCWET